MVFGIISLEHILATKSNALQVLIVAPTREIAMQIADVIKSISIHCGSTFKVQTFIGGASLKQDKLKLKSCQIAVGTPGKKKIKFYCFYYLHLSFYTILKKLLKLRKNFASYKRKHAEFGEYSFIHTGRGR